MIGSEGTLGIITAASLRLFRCRGRSRRPGSRWRRPAAALALLATLRGALRRAISAFELISAAGARLPGGDMPQVPRPPRGADAAGACWSRSPTARGPGSAPRLEAALAAALEAGLAEDALIAQNEAQRGAFWPVRETIPEANRLVGAIASHDISLPLVAARRVHRARRRRWWRRSIPTCGSTASAISATATCTTTCFRRGGAGAKALRRAARAGDGGGARPRRTRSADRSAPSTGSGG